MKDFLSLLGIAILIALMAGIVYALGAIVVGIGMFLGLALLVIFAVGLLLYLVKIGFQSLFKARKKA